MALRTSIVLALLIALVAIVLLSPLDDRPDSTSVSLQFPRESQLGTTPSLTDESDGNRSERAGPIGNPADKLNSESDIGGNGENSNQGYEVGGPIESRAIQRNSISSDFVANAGPDGEIFYELVDEFLSLANPYGAAQQQKHRQFFLEKLALSDKAVSLELLECGAILCVAEFRSAKDGALGNLMDDGTFWDGFDSRAKLEFRGDEDTTARILFSHDPNVVSIALPSAFNDQSLRE